MSLGICIKNLTVGSTIALVLEDGQKVFIHVQTASPKRTRLAVRAPRSVRIFDQERWLETYGKDLKDEFGEA